MALPKLRLVGEAVTEPDVPPVPRPLTAICCGLLPALSVKFSVAVRVPVAVGLKTMFAVQLAEAARVEPQVLLKTAKSPASVPVNPMLLMLIVVLPELVRVATFCAPVLPIATLAQLIEDGEAAAVPPVDVVPVPDSATMSGVPLAELVMVHEAVRLPVAAGLNSMLAVQLADAASDEPQVVEATVKSAASVPVSPAALRVTELEVPLVTVMV